MAFTKITNAGFGLTTGTLVGVAASFSSTVSVGGTLTYEDVTNVDSVGLITARNGIEVTDKGVQVGTGATVDSAADNTLTFLTGGNERIRVTSDGDVGIGDNAPNSNYGTNLSVHSTATDGARLKISDGSTGKGNADGLDIISTGSIAYFINRENADMAFYTNNSEALRIDSSGNFGLGTSGPKEVIDARGAAVFSGDHATSQNAYGTAHGIMLSSTSNLASIKAVSNGSNDVAIRFIPLSSGSGSEAMRIDSSGRLLVGATSSRSVSSLSSRLQVEGTGGDSSTISVTRNVASAAPPRVCLAKSRGTSVGSSIVVQSGDSLGEISFSGADGTDANSVAATILCQVDGTPGSNDMPGRIHFSTTADGAAVPTERLRITSGGQVRIGSFGAPSNKNTVTPLFHVDGSGVNGSLQVNRHTSVGGGGAQLLLSATRGSSITGHTVLQDGDGIGTVDFLGSDGGEFVPAASIQAQVDGTPGNDDMPGRLIFSTTADGASSATERMRITSAGFLGLNTSAPATDLHISGASPHIDLGPQGSNLSKIGYASLNMYLGTTSGSGEFFFKNNVASTDHPQSSGTLLAMITGNGELLVGKTVSGVSGNGGELRNGSSDYAVVATADGHFPLIVNRNTNDGGLIKFRQNNSDEGSISVSGSTVSYNGAHLARWSQLVGISTNIKSDRPTILRGSVLSNLDEMCEWGDENNEQLNRMKVSDVEGDINVAGVFQAWDDDDDTYTNDFYCAMTGDFVIRIASGVTVQRGNLLMSAGDGTAKPQGDGYIQDKTIAKVTSTTVSTTYSDGSYCVPCVLMAC